MSDKKRDDEMLDDIKDELKTDSADNFDLKEMADDTADSFVEIAEEKEAVAKAAASTAASGGVSSAAASVKNDSSEAKKSVKQTENKPKAKDPKEAVSFTTWLKEIKTEFHKIVWPNKKDLGKMTLTVICTSLLFGLVIAGMDTVFRTFIGALIDMF